MSNSQMPDSNGEQPISLEQINTIEVAQQELQKLLDILVYKDEGTIERQLEDIKGQENPGGIFERLGYLGAYIFLDPKRPSAYPHFLNLLNTYMDIQDDRAPHTILPLEVNPDTGEEFQLALYLDLLDNENIEKLFHMFDKIKLHSNGEVRMSEFHNILRMNRNMKAIVDGMKKFINVRMDKMNSNPQ